MFGQPVAQKAAVEDGDDESDFVLVQLKRTAKRARLNATAAAGASALTSAFPDRRTTMTPGDAAPGDEASNANTTNNTAL